MRRKGLVGLFWVIRELYSVLLSDFFWKILRFFSFWTKIEKLLKFLEIFLKIKKLCGYENCHFFHEQFQISWFYFGINWKVYNFCGFKKLFSYTKLYHSTKRTKKVNQIFPKLGWGYAYGSLRLEKWNNVTLKSKI